MQYLALRGIQTSFIKRHHSLINAQNLLATLLILDVVCNYVLIVGGKIRVDSRILVRCSINNNGDTRLDISAFSRLGVREPRRAMRYRRTRGCFNASSECTWCTRESPASLSSRGRRVGARYSSLIGELRSDHEVLTVVRFITCTTCMPSTLANIPFQAILSVSFRYPFDRQRPNLITTRAAAPRRFACATFTGSA